MEIENCNAEDIEEIFRLYAIASAYQKAKQTVVVWPKFERKLVETEIAENRQWKLLIDNAIACNWATTFSDEKIWEERNYPLPEGVPPEDLIRTPDNAQYFAAIGAVEFGKTEDESVGHYLGWSKLEWYVTVGREEEKAKRGGKGGRRGWPAHPRAWLRQAVLPRSHSGLGARAPAGGPEGRRSAAAHQAAGTSLAGAEAAKGPQPPAGAASIRTNRQPRQSVEAPVVCCHADPV